MAIDFQEAKGEIRNARLDNLIVRPLRRGRSAQTPGLGQGCPVRAASRCAITKRDDGAMDTAQAKLLTTVLVGDQVARVYRSRESENYSLYWYQCRARQ